VIDGLILWISTIGHSHFNINKLWLPSRIKFISSKSVSEKESLKSVVIENGSKLERIESEAFQKTGVKFVTIPDSVTFFGREMLFRVRITLLSYI
jgi:hypothetical protein